MEICCSKTVCLLIHLISISYMSAVYLHHQEVSIEPTFLDTIYVLWSYIRYEELICGYHVLIVASSKHNYSYIIIH